MLIGIIGVAAGTRLGLVDLFAPASSAAAWPRAAGAVVIALSSVLGQRAVRMNQR